MRTRRQREHRNDQAEPDAAASVIELAPPAPAPREHGETKPGAEVERGRIIPGRNRGSPAGRAHAQPVEHEWRSRVGDASSTDAATQRR